MAGVEKLVKKRAYRKGLVTKDFEYIDSLSDESLNIHLLDQYIHKLEANLVIIEDHDASICEELSDSELESVLASSRSYHFDVQQNIAQLKLKKERLLEPSKVEPPSVPSGKMFKLPLPPIQLQPFQNNSENPFAFFNFKKAFVNVLAGMPNLTEAQKFIYLKGYLQGEALVLVENIPVTDNGFSLAFQQLDFHFLDKEKIVDKVLDQILIIDEAKTLSEVEPLVRTLNNKIQDLKGLEIDLLEEDSAALLLVSKVISKKLPSQFLIELSRETCSTYPNFNQLLSKYRDILARLSLGCHESTGAKPKVKPASVMSSKDIVKSKSGFSEQHGVRGTAGPKNADTQSYSSLGKCKLCNVSGHTTSKCAVYKTLDARKSKANSLGVCVRCLSDKHNTKDCPGNKAALHYKCFSCGKAEHHGAMCPQNIKSVPEKKVFNCQTGSDVLVPVLSLLVSRGKKKARCTFLLDTGAQFSIINKQLVDRRVGKCLSPPLARTVSSFGLPASKNKGFNYSAKLTLPCGQKTDCMFFAIDNFKLTIQIPMLKSVVFNLESNGYSVSPDYPGREREIIEVDGIIGNDLLQDFSIFSLENINMYGISVKVMKVANGYIPFGSVCYFIHPAKKQQFFRKVLNKDEPWVENKKTEFNRTRSDVSINQNSFHKNKVKTVKFKSSSNKSCKSVANASSVALEKSCLKNNSSIVINSQVFYNSSLGGLGDVADKVKTPLSFTPPDTLGNQKYLVNFALNPVSHQYDPLQDIFPDSGVEYGLDNFYNLESIGIKDDDSSFYEKDQVDTFAESIFFKDGHYHVKLPWKKDLVNKVPSNLKVSLAVAERVYNKLQDQDIVDQYEDVFNQQEALGIIEPVEKRVPGQIWIPHRPVIKVDEHTTTKIRPVFNCSLKIGKSPSLNEAAFPGVDLMNNLLSLLLYFRTNDYVVLADIVKAFLQIRLSSEADRNRFCFFRRINGKFVSYRYNTIIFGFVSSPFILNYIIQHHLVANSRDEVVSLIRNKFYVDNLILSSNQADMLPQLVRRIKEIMLSGGLPLREWGSNNPTVLSLLDEEDKTSSSEMKILGYLYRADLDTFQLKNTQLNVNASSKRQILSSLSSVFDPIGIFAPILLRGKLIIRSLCQQLVDWDQQVGPETLSQWDKFCHCFQEISQTSFHRKSFNSDLPVKIFIFADASKEAYGCAIYAVQGQDSSLVFSKVKVSPLKERTLPTLELLAALLAVKCFCTIFDNGLLSETKVDSITLFVDSQVVLSWILTNKAPKKNVFVNNRLREISTALDNIKIKFTQVSLAYVPSLFNQADLLTKPCSSKTFLDKFDSWIYGPHWLVLPSSEWPKGQLGCIPCSAKSELVTPVLGPAKAEPLIDICKYSSFSKLIGVTTTFFKFVFKFKNSRADPVEAATNFLFRNMQEEVFSSELSYLKNPNVALEVPKLISQLNLFLDEHGIIRSKGRIDKNVALKYHVVNPVLMPKQHHLTKLVINYAHCSSMHMGLQSTLNFLRMHGMWILKARQAVLSVLKDCIVCKRYNASTVKYPSPASLPASRVNLSVPFAHTGVDYTGHLWLRGKGGEKVKVYILIFTCFNTRAIHLEAVESMTTAEFILAFVRFVNRYGVPSVVYSDNAKSFIQAGGIIEDLLTTSEFEERFRTASISHKTIPVYAAWYGAVWERLIKTVKHCLFKTLGRYTPSFSEFITFLSDIQKVLNNRPLTYRSCENELDIISPNHFLVGRPISSLLFGDSEQVPEWEYHEEEEYPSLLARTLECRDSLFENFRERWLQEYLINLREKDRASSHSHRVWEEGEIALFKLPAKTRAYWPLVRIVKTLPNKEGVTRTVRVSKPDGNEITVNVSHLIPLELYSELNNPHIYDMSDQSDTSSIVDNDDNGNDGNDVEVSMSSDSDSEEVPVPSTGRPSRRTAEVSRAQIRTLAGQGLL